MARKSPKASKKPAPKPRAKPKPRNAAPKKAARRGAPASASPPDLPGEFLRLVSKLGTAEAQRLLDAVVEVETPRTPRA